MFYRIVFFIVGTMLFFSSYGENLQSPNAGEPIISVVAPGIWRLQFGEPERFTPLIFRELDIAQEGLQKLGDADTPPFDLDGIHCSVTDSRTVVYIPCDEISDEIYGFGLDPACYKQKGFRKELTVAAAPVTQTGASHGPVPFYLSTKGYGVYVDTARVPTVHVARLTGKAKAVKQAVRRGDLKTKEAELYAAQNAQGKQEVVFDIPGNSSGVAVYVFAGPEMRQAVQRYNLFSGGGCMPPMWGLGMKYRTWTRADQKIALRHAQGLREHNIPVDMFGLEPGWQTQAYSCSFVWSEERFPDPDGLIGTLKNMGMRINLWEHAYVHPISPLFEPLLTRSGDYLVWGGLVVDFADPEASRIFADYHDTELVAKGIAGFKADECDRQPITDATPFNYPYCSQFPSGIDGEQMTQLYGYLYQKSILSVFKKHNQRTWGDVRATTALAAPMPFCLYSDAYAFEEYLRQLLNASFTGLLWSPEVREAGSLEEYLNRLAMSSFAPQMCINPWFIPNPLWMQYDREKNEKNELLPDEEQKRVAARMREIGELRMRLLPYLYACFYRYHAEGLPPVRSLLLDFPDDKALRDIDTEFLFGDNLLVAPFPGAYTSREVYLPAGVRWHNFRTGEQYEGGTTITVTAQAGDIPVFVRDNCLLPLAEPMPYVADDAVFNITVQVYGEKPVPFELVEDDGISYDYEQGSVNTVRLSWEQNSGKAEQQGGYDKERYIITDWKKI
jgi:alpha-D-xyloside xylohydrolase